MAGAGKGSTQRPVDPVKFAEGWASAFDPPKSKTAPRGARKPKSTKLKTGHP